MNYNLYVVLWYLYNDFHLYLLLMILNNL
jgi:hypothetical protein